MTFFFAKLKSIAFTWGAALLVSGLLRWWGRAHPEPFAEQSILVFSLLLVPSLVAATWVIFNGLFRIKNE